MLFYENLDEIVFNRHDLIRSDELIVLSGYVGPAPIRRLEQLPISSTVIYGMYGSDGIHSGLHTTLIELDNAIANTEIYYSNLPVHSKCYIWRYRTDVVHALIGSANFSANGLTTPYRETLAETTIDTFEPLNRYLETVMNNSIRCFNASGSIPTPVVAVMPRIGNICTMVLYDTRTGEVQSAAGLNWGQSATAHVTPDDAYIPIKVEHIKQYPDMFPVKQAFPVLTAGTGRTRRHNDTVDIIWDDGTTMTGLLEGSQMVGHHTYPKQLSTHPEKKILGQYIKERIGVPLGQKVTMSDLKRYGRTDIKVSLQGEGIYYFDFSVD